MSQILRLRTTLTLELKDTTCYSPCCILNAEVVPRKETQAIWHWKGWYVYYLSPFDRLIYSNEQRLGSKPPSVAFR